MNAYTCPVCGAVTDAPGPGVWHTLNAEGAIRHLLEWPRLTEADIWQHENLAPFLRHATAAEARRLSELLASLFEAKQGTRDDEAARYRRAVGAVEAEGEKATDERVAERLGVTARTIGNWRHKGLI